MTREDVCGNEVNLKEIKLVFDELGFFGKHFLNTIQKKNKISIQEISDVYSIGITLTRKLIKQYQKDIALLVVEDDIVSLTDFAKKVLEGYKNKKPFVFRSSIGDRKSSKLIAIELPENEETPKEKYKKLCLVETEVIKNNNLYSIPFCVTYPRGNAKESSRSSEIIGDKKEVANSINAFLKSECEESFGLLVDESNRILSETIYNKIKVPIDTLYFL